MVLAGGKVVVEDSIIENGYLLIEGQTIQDIGPLDEMPSKYRPFPTMQIGADQIILPGFIDVHIHGAAGSDVMDATPHALQTIAEALPKEGTTSFLATTITQSEEAIAKAVETASRFMKTNYTGAEVLGIHLEGPFINPKHANAQPRDKIIPPNIELFDKWQRLAGQTIRLVTMAPEENGGDLLIKHLAKTGVIASVGHSDATFHEVKKAVSAGLTHATHLYNAMRPMHHREPGVVGAVLLEENTMAEIIFDEVHVSKEMVQLAYQLKGSRKLQLITDAMRAKCLTSGEYDLGGQKVTVQGNQARLADGTLAGSVLRMNHAVKNASTLVGCSLHDLVRLSSGNAAEELGVFARKGSLAVGKDADIVILNSDFNVQTTFCRGKIRYSVNKERDI
nr:N-acetylglucosamine-6-phosphate deacetylase [Aneurinibacillus terranovensis]